MLYYLLYPLRHAVSAFNLFRYITFRAAYATLTALLVSFILGPFIIRRLRKLHIQEKIRDDGPQTHLAKEGTPTMGGLIILLAIVLPTLLWADLTNRYILLILFSTVWMGTIGFIDDYLKAVRHIPKGLVAKWKLVGQITFGLILGCILYFWPLSTQFHAQTSIPFLKNWVIDFGILYIPFVVFVTTGASNALNLTDGLDGLAIGIVTTCAMAFAGMSYVSGRVDFSGYLNIMYLTGSGELTVFLAAIVGASLGFLWFNAHPAKVFMGDTGSLALGGALSAAAILLKKEVQLLIVGGVFAVEALSVIIQIVSYKLRGGKRVFLMAPLHHHFELKGWPESLVVVRFWIISAMLALLSLSTFKIR
jgi:phospho-N-acetylmuramoyl-pentapeptide-transferase